ncbi:MAG: WG repeat-containing protein [Actinobacteria bacterium]|nr:WG repeat-containing protein [Actinomycetota bacterium]
MRLSISRRFSEGLAAAYTIEGIDGVQAGLEGYVDVSGALVIEPQFNRAGNFS